MHKLITAIVIFAAMLITADLATTSAYNIFLPIVFKPLPPTATSTPLPTSIPISTPTPIPTPSTTGNINIVSIFYDGSGANEPDEYVIIQNIDTHPIYMTGWTLRDDANHIYSFPNVIMQSNQICRIYTNESHMEWCGFTYGSTSAIWNNTGDCAHLRNSTNVTVDDYCY